MTKDVNLTVRISVEMREKLDKAREGFPYKPTVTAIVERGIELALAEIEAMKKVRT